MMMKEIQKEDHKFAKELEECSDKGIEISQECKEYYNRKFEYGKRKLRILAHSRDNSQRDTRIVPN